MGKEKEKEMIVERKGKRKKKKGRPSLLDLQKRSLKLQQQQQHKNRKKSTNSSSKLNTNTNRNYKSATPTPTPTPPPRRSTRSHPSPQEALPELDGKRREKKQQLKLIVLKKLPLSDEEEDEEEEGEEEDDDNDAASNRKKKKNKKKKKKRKINAIADGSADTDTDADTDDDEDKGSEKKPVSGTNPANSVQDLGPSTPLPDQKLLLFILDRLQKKDTYGVFADPVDPEELPDYHEVIEHPMDFGTIRKKLSSGAYANLEQFEKDVLLICSNAMQYNAPDTIYFRQARSIQELALKNFENLRQDSDDNEAEPKVARRGRPPNKNLKKPLGRPLLDRTGPAFSSDATLATREETSISLSNELRRGPHLSEKFGIHSSRNDACSLGDKRFDRNSEGSILKSNPMKHGKKQFALDERRNTYSLFHPTTVAQEPSIWTTFGTERKQLVAVGLLSEHGYARSLARFAANMGQVAWTIASKRIERSLPPGLKYGPGWVGENDIVPQRSLLISSVPPAHLANLFSVPQKLVSAVAASNAEMKEEKFLGRAEENKLLQKEEPSAHSPSEGHLRNSLAQSGQSEQCSERAEVDDGLNSRAVIGPRPSFQIHQSPVYHPGLNGCNGTYGFNLPVQTGKLIGTAKPAGVNIPSSWMVDTNSRDNTNSIKGVNANSLKPEMPKILDNLGGEAQEAPRSEHQSHLSMQGSSQRRPDSGPPPEEKSDSVPPDLNVRFQSPGSPSSSNLVGSSQPDLALQL